MIIVVNFCLFIYLIDQVYMEHKRTVNRVVFHPFEQQQLMSGSQDGSMKLFVCWNSGLFHPKIFKGWTRGGGVYSLGNLLRMCRPRHERPQRRIAKKHPS